MPTQQLHELIKGVWEQDEIPEPWRISVLCQQTTTKHTKTTK